LVQGPAKYTGAPDVVLQIPEALSGGEQVFTLPVYLAVDPGELTKLWLGQFLGV
jgi:hypothetical protein